MFLACCGTLRIYSRFLVCHDLQMNESKRVYLDYAAATPLLEAAFSAMEPYLKSAYGNPSAIHAEGQVARATVEKARADIAAVAQVRPEYVTFTGGGTEGNNLALFGVIDFLLASGKSYADLEIITTRIEHPSVLVAVQKLADLGVTVQYVSVGETGKINLQHLKEILSAKTVLVTCAYANSEIGTIQPLHAIKKAITEAEKKYTSEIFFQVDAAQAPMWLSCQFATVGADLLVLDFAKCNGPKGTGALLRSRRVQVKAVLFGGGQESGLRPGTENVPGIVGAAVAFTQAQASWRERSAAVAKVRDAGINLLKNQIEGLVLNGERDDNRLANNINISLPGLDTEFAAVVLDSKGFAVSTKSACAGAGGGASVVVSETTLDPARAAATLRFSLAPETTIENLQQLTSVLKVHIEHMKTV